MINWSSLETNRGILHLTLISVASLSMGSLYQFFGNIGDLECLNREKSQKEQFQANELRLESFTKKYIVNNLAYSTAIIEYHNYLSYFELFAAKSEFVRKTHSLKTRS